MPQFTSEQLREVTTAVFSAAGAPEDISDYMAESLVECNLMGHDSHGVLRIPSYIERIESGRLVASARPSILKETSSTAVIKGNWAFGQFAARFAAQVVIRKAEEAGIAAVGIVECNHQGRLGEFSTMIARKGMIGIVTTGGSSSRFAVVAPYGGAGRVLGTNPISMAVPAGTREPFVADFATSAVAEGKLMYAQAKGVPVPEGIVVDAEGRPSTDPSVYRRGGALLPFGGHKGYALAVFADLVGSLLSGSDVFGEPPFTYGTFMMALKIDNFRPLSEFVASVDHRFAEIKSVPPAPGFEEVLIPGEPEARTKAERLTKGISIPEDTWNKIVAIAQRYGVDAEGVLKG